MVQLDYNLWQALKNMFFRFLNRVSHAINRMAIFVMLLDTAVLLPEGLAKHLLLHTLQNRFVNV